MQLKVHALVNSPQVFRCCVEGHCLNSITHIIDVTSYFLSRSPSNWSASLFFCALLAVLTFHLGSQTWEICLVPVCPISCLRFLWNISLCRILYQIINHQHKWNFPLLSFEGQKVQKLASPWNWNISQPNDKINTFELFEQLCRFESYYFRFVYWISTVETFGASAHSFTGVKFLPEFIGENKILFFSSHISHLSTSSMINW